MTKRKLQSLDEFIEEESTRDPAFKKALAREEARTIRERLGRPPKATTKKGFREMRLNAPPAVAERIRKAAKKENRTVSNWLLLAAQRQLAET